MRLLIWTLVIGFGLAAPTAMAQDMPDFLKKTLPEHAASEIVQAYGKFSKESVLDTKTRELIALGVSAQIPCTYCVYGHTAAAKKAGATDAEVRDAVAMASYIRFFSTVLNGNAYDLEAYKTERDALLEGSR